MGERRETSARVVECSGRGRIRQLGSKTDAKSELTDQPKWSDRRDLLSVGVDRRFTEQSLDPRAQEDAGTPHEAIATFREYVTPSEPSAASVGSYVVF